MGLFDKKYCDVCGEKIGLLGNRKLADGNLCKACAGKLSPFFTERRESTVEEIKAQLVYRAENERQLLSFSPNTVMGGEDRKIHLDTVSKRFIVTDCDNWRKENPDLISLSQVSGCETRVEEDEIQIFKTDKEGNEVSYNPPRYQTEYSFYVTVYVDSPYFQEIEVRLNDEYRPNSRTSQHYKELKEQADQIAALLKKDDSAACESVTVADNSAATQTVTADAGWICSCGSSNRANFCGNCGAPKPKSNCNSCGWKIPDTANPPNFCPNCGTKLA